MSGGVNPANRLKFGVQIMQQLGQSMTETKTGDVAGSCLAHFAQDLQKGATKGQPFFDRVVQIMTQADTGSEPYKGMKEVLDQLPEVKKAVQKQSPAFEKAQIMQQAYKSWIVTESSKLKTTPHIGNHGALAAQILQQDPKQRQVAQAMLAAVTHPAVADTYQFQVMAAELESALETVPQTVEEAAALAPQPLDARALAQANMTAEMLRDNPKQISQLSIRELDNLIEKLGTHPAHQNMVQELREIKETKQKAFSPVRDFLIQHFKPGVVDDMIATNRVNELLGLLDDDDQQAWRVRGNIGRRVTWSHPDKSLAYVHRHVQRSVFNANDDLDFVDELNLRNRRNQERFLTVEEVKAYQQNLSSVAADGSKYAALGQRIEQAIPQMEQNRKKFAQYEKRNDHMFKHYRKEYEMAESYIPEYNRRLKEGMDSLERTGVDVRAMREDPEAQWTAMLQNNLVPRALVERLQTLFGHPGIDMRYGDIGRALKVALDNTAGAAPVPEVNVEARGALRALRATMKPHGGISVENLKQHMSCPQLEEYIRLIPESADTLIVGQLKEALEQRRAPLFEALEKVLDPEAIKQVFRDRQLPLAAAELLRVGLSIGSFPSLNDIGSVIFQLREYHAILNGIVRGDMGDTRGIQLLKARDGANGDKAQFKRSIYAMGRERIERYADFLVDTFASGTWPYQLGLDIQETLAE